MKFLLDCGFSEDLIDKMRERYDESTIDIFKLESDNVINVIDYFKEIGLECIDELLLFRIEVFTKDIEFVKETFNNHDVSVIVKDINDDITNIDYI